MNQKKTWEEFRRFHGSDSFYGCVAHDGTWFDSANSFDNAVHWCACDAGEHNLSPEQEKHWMETKGRRLGLSIIHSKMLEQMYEKGLIK
jgi:hypothetical protein